MGSFFLSSNLDINLSSIDTRTTSHTIFYMLIKEITPPLFYDYLVEPVVKKGKQFFFSICLKLTLDPLFNYSNKHVSNIK